MSFTNNIAVNNCEKHCQTLDSNIITADTTTELNNSGSDIEDQDILCGDSVGGGGGGGRDTPVDRRRRRLQSIIDPSYAPKILRKNKSITRAESMGSLVGNESKVLVLFTGGTIGMMKSAQGVYEPRAGALVPALRKYPQLHDPDYVEKHLRMPKDNSPLVLPDTGESNRIVYTIYEYEPLLDSSNFTVDDWINIALDIQQSYQHFNGFVILHGTDTMAYTASALSYMLENLGKTVVITGSQIPLFEPRSDGRENLLNSLIIAGNYSIPEVSILFNNKLMRGNRTSKVSTSLLDAFDSPNMPPLATIGININVDWNNVFRWPTIAKFCVHSILSRNVGLLRLFPSISVETIQAFLMPPIEGVVLQTYGAGNAPSNRADILAELRAATDRGVLIVNITQCFSGQVMASYETGNALVKAGVICGSDMTPEACLTKLSYVLSKHQWTIAEKRKMIETNLCGELSSYLDTKFEDIELIRGIAQSLRVSTSQEMQALRNALYPAIVCAIAAKGDCDQLNKLNRFSGADLSGSDYELRTPLHTAISNKHKDVVEYLLSEGASVHAKDKNNETPLQMAIQHDLKEIVVMLVQAGAHLDGSSTTKMADMLTKAAAKGNVKRLETLCLAGVNINEVDTFGRTALHVAIERDQKSVVEFLVKHRTSDDETNLLLLLSKTDIYGRNAYELAKHFGRHHMLEMFSQLLLSKSGNNCIIINNNN
ncbi:L-asparaginase-like, partial [Oppia nitens]|uniref:L-asparaginase-like n=1 Tax=Oppia nitens TaxID=1686743 RepID=UPI0023DAA337